MESKAEFDILMDVEVNTSVESSIDYATSKNLDHSKLIGILKSFESDGVLKLHPREKKHLALTSEAKEILKKGILSWKKDHLSND